MKKLLLALVALPALSFATPLDMATLACKSVKLNASTTLSDVQASCLIRKQTMSKGRYEVKFRNDTTQKNVTCYFADNNPKSLLNSCE